MKSNQGLRDSNNYAEKTNDQVNLAVARAQIYHEEMAIRMKNHKNM